MLHWHPFHKVHVSSGKNSLLHRHYPWSLVKKQTSLAGQPVMGQWRPTSCEEHVPFTGTVVSATWHSLYPVHTLTLPTAKIHLPHFHVISLKVTRESLGKKKPMGSKLTHKKYLGMVWVANDTCLRTWTWFTVTLRGWRTVVRAEIYCYTFVHPQERNMYCITPSWGQGLCTSSCKFPKIFNENDLLDLQGHWSGVYELTLLHIMLSIIQYQFTI